MLSVVFVVVLIVVLILVVILVVLVVVFVVLIFVILIVRHNKVPPDKFLFVYRLYAIIVCEKNFFIQSGKIFKLWHELPIYGI